MSGGWQVCEQSVPLTVACVISKTYGQQLPGVGKGLASHIGLNADHKFSS